MKNITLTLYEFSELDEEAKEFAKKELTRAEHWAGYIFAEAYDTFKKFAEIFCIKNWVIDYLERQRNSYRIYLPENIKELSGLRLQKYIWNNYKEALYRGKYYGKIVGERHIKRYSKCIFDKDYVLTGVCYDMDILNPIYEFLDKPSDISFEELIDYCIDNFCKAVENEYESTFDDDYISDYCLANDIYFMKTGEKFINN